MTNKLYTKNYRTTLYKRTNRELVIIIQTLKQKIDTFTVYRKHIYQKGYP